jgi:O-antigen ligase
MLKLLRWLTVFGVIIHLSLLLAESSYFGDLFVCLGHTGLMIVHITVLTFVSAAAFPALLKQRHSKAFASLTVISLLYAAWEVFCTLPKVHTVDRMCEMILSPLTIFALLLCAPCVLERVHYRGILLFFSGILALHTLAVVWIMLTGDTTYFGRTLMGTDGRPKIVGGMEFLQTDGIFRSPNGIGSFLSLFPGILLAEILTAKRKFRAPLLAAAVVIGIGLFLSFCRAAQAAALVGLLIPLIVFLKQLPVKRMLLGAPILLGTIFACLPDHHQSEYIKSALCQHLGGGVHHVAAFLAHTISTRRTEIWLAFFRDWQTHPVFGYGLLGVDYQGLGPHNFLLANLVYFGIPGALLVVALLAVATNRVWSRWRECPEVLVPIGGALAALVVVHGSVEYSITYPLYFTNSAFWLLLGYACFTQLGSKDQSHCNSILGYSKTEAVREDGLPNEIVTASPR